MSTHELARLRQLQASARLAASEREALGYA
jgi:hypothetical protein